MSHNRDFLLSKITCGRLYYTDDIYIENPDVHLKFQADRLYTEVLERGREEVYADGDMVNVLTGCGLWSTQDEEDIMVNIPEQINDLKVEIYDAGPLEYRRLASEIGELGKKLRKMYVTRHQFDAYTVEGIAETARIEFLLLNTTKFDPYKYRWKNIDLHDLVKFYGNRYINEDTIRDLAKNNPWSEIWRISKKNNGYVFNPDATLLSDDQRKLILWSALYDDIKEAHEPPSDEVIKDDLRLDGWLIKKSRENQEKKKVDDIKISTNARINNSQDVFVICKNVEEARAINSLNTFQGNLTKKARLTQIQRDGSVDKAKFADVKQELKIAINREQMRNGR